MIKCSKIQPAAVAFFTQSERHKFLSGSGVVVEFVLFDAILVHLSSGGLFFSGPRILLVVVDTVLGDDWGKYVQQYLKY